MIVTIENATFQQVQQGTGDTGYVANKVLTSPESAMDNQDKIKTAPSQTSQPKDIQLA